MVQAINKLRIDRNTIWFGGRLSTRDVWVHTRDLSEFFDIHPHRISSKIRRMNKRGLTSGGGWNSRGDIVLKAAGESLLRGRPYNVEWCRIKKEHFGHEYLVEGVRYRCPGYSVPFRSRPEPDEEFIWPEEED